MRSVKVLEAETEVEIGPEGAHITARVMSVMIDEDGVSYKVVWWDDNNRKTEWLRSFELRPGKDSEYFEIGFHANR